MFLVLGAGTVVHILPSLLLVYLDVTPVFSDT